MTGLAGWLAGSRILQISLLWGTVSPAPNVGPSGTSCLAHKDKLYGWHAVWGVGRESCRNDHDLVITGRASALNGRWAESWASWCVKGRPGWQLWLYLHSAEGYRRCLADMARIQIAPCALFFCLFFVLFTHTYVHYMCLLLQPKVYQVSFFGIIYTHICPLYVCLAATKGIQSLVGQE